MLVYFLNNLTISKFQLHFINEVKIDIQKVKVTLQSHSHWEVRIETQFSTQLN